MIIDCQSHVFDPRWLAYLESRTSDPRASRTPQGWEFVLGPLRLKLQPDATNPIAKLRAMDVAGVEIALISSNLPGPHTYGADGVRMATQMHDWLAEIVAAHPDRFVFVCTPPMHDVEAALAEIDRCVDTHDARAVQLYSHINGVRPDAPEFEPFWAAMASAGLPVILHPHIPVFERDLAGHQMSVGLGMRFEDTIILTHLIMSGLLDRYPDLQIVCPHLGGTLPFFAGQIDHQAMVLKRGADHITQAPSEYLNQVFYDCAAPWSPALRLCLDVIGATRLVFASDHPWIQPRLIAEMIDAMNLSASDRTLILSGNAKQLFRIP